MVAVTGIRLPREVAAVGALVLVVLLRRTCLSACLLVLLQCVHRSLKTAILGVRLALADAGSIRMLVFPCIQMLVSSCCKSEEDTKARVRVWEQGSCCGAVGAVRVLHQSFSPAINYFKPACTLSRLSSQGKEGWGSVPKPRNCASCVQFDPPPGPARESNFTQLAEFLGFETEPQPSFPWIDWPSFPSAAQTGRPGAATAALRHTRGSMCERSTLRLPAACVRPQREHCTTVPLSVAGTAWLGSAPYRNSTRTCGHTHSFTLTHQAGTRTRVSP